MAQPLTQRTIESSQPKSTAYDLRDGKVNGLLLRVYPTGRKAFYVQYARGKRIIIGRADLLTLTQARNKALAILAEAAHTDPMAAKRTKPVITMADFLRDTYGPWARTNRKTGADTIKRMTTCFSGEMGRKLTEFSPWIIEKWRTARMKAGIKPATINRDLVALKAALAMAVEWGVITEHPLAKVKPSVVEDESRVRYLGIDEEQRLRAALDRREQVIRENRRSGNAWRAARNFELKPDLDRVPFADHIKPLILTAMNTGLRRGELFNLTWADVDMTRALLTVRAASAKTARVRRIPLNREVLDTLTAWQATTGATIGHVFASPYGGRLDNIKKAWAGIVTDAQVEGFRFHDLRHHFASRLAMAGADLYVVKELLGHSTIAMTERYAHLAPEHRAAAVRLLDVAR
ncbi:MAG: tyrosine-type recombinase/integrase [Porticoccaceae bacterium]